MRTLPLISHHLFVSAVGHEDGSESESAFSRDLPPRAQEVPIEVLDATKEIPANARPGGFRFRSQMKR
jgi:hypothetical protein